MVCHGRDVRRRKLVLDKHLKSRDELVVSDECSRIYKVNRYLGERFVQN